MTSRSRVRRAVFSVLLLAFLAAISSFYRARGIANQYVGVLPANLRQTHHGFVPFRPYPPGHWAWAISYVDANDDGFDVYVSLLGTVVGTNPPGLRDRLPFTNAAASISTAPPNER